MSERMLGHSSNMEIQREKLKENPAHLIGCLSSKNQEIGQTECSLLSYFQQHQSTSNNNNNKKRDQGEKNMEVNKK